MHAPSATLAFAALAATAASQVNLNEIYASHTGTDDQEFVELIGTPGATLRGHMVLVVEGDGLAAGTLDRAWDLTGLTVPADGYLVVGDAAVPNVDLVVGATNTIENGTETVYLVLASNPPAVTALVGTDVDPEDDGTTTLPALVTILDLVALTDGDAVDVTHDGATVLGPDGPFFPAGIYRTLDAPGPWCSRFLDFDAAANADQPRTPGAGNGPCPATIVFGLPNVALGQAVLTPGVGTLTVSNIGASGEDGVSIDLGQAEYYLTTIDLPVNERCDVWSFMSRQTGMELEGRPSGDWDLSLDVETLQPAALRVDLIRDGQLVLSQTRPPPPTGTPLVIVPPGVWDVLPGRASPAGDEWIIMIRADVAQPVSIPGGPTLPADRVLLTALDVSSPAQLIVTGDVSLAGGDAATILAEGVGKFGVTHHVLGQATLATKELAMCVQNIGSSGLDGVCVRAEDTLAPGDEVSQIVLALQQYPPGQVGGSMTVTPFGSLGGVRESPLGTMTFAETAPGVVAIDADLSALGSPTMRVQAFANGQLVADLSGVPAGPVGTADGWPLGVGKLGDTILGGDVTKCLVGTWPPGTTFALGTLVVSGDELRMLAESLGAPIDFQQGLDVLLADTPDLVVVGVDVQLEAWTDLGCALAGTGGEPVLEGVGPLTPGSQNALFLTSGAPSAIGVLFVSLGAGAVPFKGGTLKTVPVALTLPLTLTPSGEVGLIFAWPPGVPPGTEIVFQCAIADQGAPANVALSNALQGETP